VRPIPRFLGGAIGHELQSDQRVGVRYHLAGIYAVVDCSCHCPAAEDTSITEKGKRNAKYGRFEYQGMTRISATATAEILEEAKRRGYQ